LGCKTGGAKILFDVLKFNSRKTMSTVVEEYAVLQDKPRVATSSPSKLTLEQANQLAHGKPFELIDGRMVFKMELKNIFVRPGAAK